MLSDAVHLPARPAINRRAICIAAGLVALLVITSIGVVLYNHYHYPNVRGNYVGTYQFTSGSGPFSISLSIKQENGASIGALFTLHNTRFTVNNATVDHSGNIQFSFTDLTNTIGFTGAAQCGGGWQGTFGDSMGQSGTWNVLPI